MKTLHANSVTEYLSLVNSINTEHDQKSNKGDAKKGNTLYRGQKNDYPLLPKIARQANLDSQHTESYLISEFKIRAKAYKEVTQLDIWGILTLAQHYGLATRLLDWSRNPLVALWFSCTENSANDEPHVYILLPHWGVDLLDREITKNTSEHRGISILRTRQEDSRVTSQDGWFTVHSPSQKYGRFIPLGELPHHAEGMFKIKINPKSTPRINEELDILGISFQTIFPDLEGLCKYLNWKATSQEN